MIEILLAGVAFAAAGALGILAARYVCAGMVPAADGPPPGTVSVQLLIVANGLLGALAGMRGLTLGQLAIVALVCGVLSAIWVADVTLGIIPDVFTLAPLGAVILAALLSHHWEVAISAVVPAVPFAVLAWRSGGIGLGWGDVKLAGTARRLRPVSRDRDRVTTRAAHADRSRLTKTYGDSAQPLDRRRLGG